MSDVKGNWEVTNPPVATEPVTARRRITDIVVTQVITGAAKLSDGYKVWAAAAEAAEDIAWTTMDWSVRPSLVAAVESAGMLYAVGGRLVRGSTYEFRAQPLVVGDVLVTGVSVLADDGEDQLSRWMTEADRALLGVCVWTNHHLAADANGIGFVCMGRVIYEVLCVDGVVFAKERTELRQ